MAHGIDAAPITQTQRLLSVDVLRGCALLGILAMNVMVFAMPYAAYVNPTAFTEHSGTNQVVFWFVHIVFDYKMMALFSMLFGAGVVIWSRKAETKAEARSLRWVWLRRMWWLFVIGMIHAWLIWEGDILVSYAVCGALALWWLRRLPPVWLVVVAGAFFGVQLLAVWLQGYMNWMLFTESDQAARALNEAVSQGYVVDPEATRLVQRSIMDPTAAQLEEQLGALTGSWMEVSHHRAKIAAYIQFGGLPFFIFWRVTSMMLLGAALMKWDVFTGKRTARFYAGMAAAGYALGVPMILAGLVYNESHGFDIVKTALYGMWGNNIGSVPMALGHAGLILWVVKKGYLAFLTSALARVGQMAFTNYLMQSVLCSLIFYGWGLGFAGEFGRLGQELVVVGIWIVQILWSVAWLSRFRFGPAEWLWRSLTYWELQPMRRDDASMPSTRGSD